MTCKFVRCCLVLHSKNMDEGPMDVDNDMGIDCGRGAGWVEEGEEGKVGVTV